jgi:hypothetical protein
MDLGLPVAGGHTEREAVMESFAPVLDSPASAKEREETD